MQGVLVSHTRGQHTDLHTPAVDRSPTREPCITHDAYTRCTHHAHIPCTYTMHTYHAYTMHIPCIYHARPCIYHAHIMRMVMCTHHAHAHHAGGLAQAPPHGGDRCRAVRCYAQPVRLLGEAGQRVTDLQAALKRLQPGHTWHAAALAHVTACLGTQGCSQAATRTPAWRRRAVGHHSNLLPTS